MSYIPCNYETIKRIRKVLQYILSAVTMKIVQEYISDISPATPFVKELHDTTELTLTDYEYIKIFRRRATIVC
jgi:hypothetical protein